MRQGSLSFTPKIGIASRERLEMSHFGQPKIQVVIFGQGKLGPISAYSTHEAFPVHCPRVGDDVLDQIPITRRPSEMDAPWQKTAPLIDPPQPLAKYHPNRRLPLQHRSQAPQILGQHRIIRVANGEIPTSRAGNQPVPN